MFSKCKSNIYPNVQSQEKELSGRLITMKAHSTRQTILKDVRTCETKYLKELATCANTAKAITKYKKPQ